MIERQSDHPCVIFCLIEVIGRLFASDRMWFTPPVDRSRQKAFVLSIAKSRGICRILAS